MPSISRLVFINSHTEQKIERMISEHFDHYGDHYGFCEIHGENQSIKSLMPQTQLQNIKNFTKSATGHYHKTSDFFKHETRLFTLEDWMAP